MYVDDPLLCMVGSASECVAASDVVISWWLVLGLPLSWSKGTMCNKTHRWIGADFSTRTVQGHPAGVVSVPPSFASELFDLLSPLSKGTGHVSESFLDRVLGKAGRLAYLVPAARPYVHSLWGALAGSKAAQAKGHKEAPPHRFAARRFAAAAKWLQVLLRPPADQAEHIVPLEQIVLETLPPIELGGPTVHVDASLWGAGGVLYLENVPAEFWSVSWSSDLASLLQTSVGDPSAQTTWEYLAVLICLLIWGKRFSQQGLAVLGDNLASLTGTLNLKGRKSLNAISRELSWRQVRQSWRFAAGHLPTEHNHAADALSRLSAPETSERKAFPAELRDCREIACPDLLAIWTV